MGKHQSIPLPVVATLVTTSALALILRLIPYEYTDRHRAPKFVFHGGPSAFHLFKVLVMFGFSSTFSSMFLGKRPKMERFCCYYSMVSMASAIGLLFLCDASSL